MQRFLWRIRRAGYAVLLLALGAVGCSGAGPESEMEPRFFANETPALLSAWGQLDVSNGALELSEGVVPYDLNTPLFTDYALKLRTIWLPGGSAPGIYREQDYPDLPVGTVITKTFFYARGEHAGNVLKISETSGGTHAVLDELKAVRLMETRLLVRRDRGWEAISYVWNDDQTDAMLNRIGDAQKLTLVTNEAEDDFVYIVPDINQCAGCHAPNNTTRELAPLGFRPRHLNKAYTHDGQSVNQLEHLQAVGYLEGVTSIDAVQTNAVWTDEDVALDLRARSYLDINCSHCHNPVGPADTSGLDLTMQAALGPELGVCKLPIAAGSGTGGRAFSIVPGEPDASILMHRVETTDPGAMMPELGRALKHQEGADLLRAWIDEMEGGCST